MPLQYTLQVQSLDVLDARAPRELAAAGADEIFSHNIYR